MSRNGTIDGCLAMTSPKTSLSGIGMQVFLVADHYNGSYTSSYRYDEGSDTFVMTRFFTWCVYIRCAGKKMLQTSLPHIGQTNPLEPSERTRTSS